MDSERNTKENKRSTCQPSKHAPKTKMQAVARRQKLIKGLMDGKAIKDIAPTLGLSPKTCVNQASLMLREPNVQTSYVRILEEAGLTDKFLSEKAKTLIDAKTTIFAQKDGRFTDSREVDALETQRKTWETVNKLKGHLKDHVAGDVNIGLMQMIVQAVNAGDSED